MTSLPPTPDLRTVQALLADTAWAAIADAPAPAIVIAGEEVHANRIAARWLHGLDAALPADAGRLPAAHPFERDLKHAAQRAARSVPHAAVRLALPAPFSSKRVELTVRTIGDGGSSPLIVWLHPDPAFDSNDDVAGLPGDMARDVTDTSTAGERQRLLARLQLATRMANIGVWETVIDERQELLDDTTCRILGFGAGPQVRPSEEFTALFHHEDLARVRDGYQAALTGADPSPHTLAFRILRGGEVRHLMSHLAVERDVEGTPRRVLGTVLDVTELRAAERRAQEYAAWLSIATGGAGMGVWDLDPDSDAFIADDRAHQLFGGQLQPSPTPYARFEALVDPADRARVREAIIGATHDGGRIDTEYRVLLPGGARIMAARGETHRDGQGRPIRMIGVVWDVTERRAADAAAREATERLQLAAIGAGVGCWERSVDGRRAVWDAQMHRLFGATPGEAPPHQIFLRCIHAEDVPRIERARTEALRTGEFQVEYRIRRADGELRWLSARGRTRYAADGPPTALIGVTWDITEARVADTALRAKETAERANRAKSEFLARMSHELRTPLNAIVGFTQLLELDRHDPLTITQRERVSLIRSSGWQLLTLINDVLDLARIESGRSGVSMEVVAWREVLEEAIAMVQPEATARGIALETLATGNVSATVWADPVRLRQVLLNLLSNAVKYNRDHGSVQINVRSEGMHVVFAVRDCGRGMSAGQIGRLFQPFDRLGVDGSAPAGTGIGLAISQRLMQQMEGAIDVESQPGVGSEFRARLRSASVETLQTPVATSTPALSVRDEVGGTLLYIEDNPANSALVEQFLHFRPRIKLYQAADGATGLVMAAVCQPDLVLVDMRLPDMMGDDVLRQLRQQAETRNIPCVAVSANALPNDIEAALAAGFADYWTKPLDVTHFLRGIDLRLTAAATDPAAAPASKDVQP